MKQLFINVLSVLHPMFRALGLKEGSKRTGNNRRKSDRIPLHTDVKVRMMGQEIQVAECKNISSGGMCLVFQTPPPEAKSGTVWLSREYSKDDLRFEASFRKVWSKAESPDSQRTVMGIIFQELVPIQRDTLHIILQRESKSRT